MASIAFGRNPQGGTVSIAEVTLTAPSRAQSRDVGAVRAATGAITVTTVSVLPVFLTGALAVQLGDELGFDPAGLGLVVALYFGVSALCSLPVGRLVERWGGAVTRRIAVLGVAVVIVLAVSPTRTPPSSRSCFAARGATAWASWRRT